MDKGTLQQQNIPQVSMSSVQHGAAVTEDEAHALLTQMVARVGPDESSTRTAQCARDAFIQGDIPAICDIMMCAFLGAGTDAGGAADMDAAATTADRGLARLHRCGVKTDTAREHLQGIGRAAVPRICGHVFAPGDICWNCRDCQVGDDTCVICMEAPTDATLVHGGSAHVCCCLSCAQNLQRLEQTCPMCRKPIEQVLQLFFA